MRSCVLIRMIPWRSISASASVLLPAQTGPDIRMMRLATARAPT